jgi:hypothetical protein
MLRTNSSQGLKFVMEWYVLFDTMFRESFHSFPMFERGLVNIRILGSSLWLN